MAATAIEWCDFTFNPWIGCSKVHTGCQNCYAEADQDKRRGRVKWGPQGTRSRTSDANWKLPLTWNRKAEKAGERKRVFCASLADVFEDWTSNQENQKPIYGPHGQQLFMAKDGGYVERPLGEYDSRWVMATMSDLRRDLFVLIDRTPFLTWLLLTKRPENIRRMWPGMNCRSNVWLGCSISDQETADKYLPELLRCRDLARALFVSYEPALGPVDFGIVPCKACNSLEPQIQWPCPYCHCRRFDWPDWIIIGGESGLKARPCNLAWLRSVVEQCKKEKVACFMKQLGSRPFEEEAADQHLPIHARELAKKYGAGPLISKVTEYRLKDPKGGDPAEWPEDLRVREFPEVSVKT